MNVRSYGWSGVMGVQCGGGGSGGELNREGSNSKNHSSYNDFISRKLLR